MAPLLAMLEGLCGWPRGDFRVKLDDYAKIRDDVFEFCRFYAKFLGNPLMGEAEGRDIRAVRAGHSLVGRAGCPRHHWELIRRWSEDARGEDNAYGEI